MPQHPLNQRCLPLGGWAVTAEVTTTLLFRMVSSDQEETNFLAQQLPAGPISDSITLRTEFYQFGP